MRLMGVAKKGVKRIFQDAVKSLHSLAIGALCLRAGLAQPESGRSSPTFADDIAGILYENCVVCHRPDGVGPFSLIGYDDAARRARQIGEVVESRFMPPWKPDPDRGPAIIGERSLSEETIAEILAWVEAGAPSGDLASVPEPPAFAGSWTLGEPDLVLELPEEYILPAAGTDIYRNFVIPSSETKERWASAVEFLPETRLAIHHSVIQSDSTGSARKREAEDPAPGFDGMELAALVDAQSTFIGWAPGQTPFEAYEGTAWKLPAGADIVLQLHMLPSGKPEPIKPKIGLYFADGPPEKETISVSLQERDLDIPAGAEDYTVEESITLPAPVKIVSVGPHAHYLAKNFRLFAKLPDGGMRWILHIPDWDFNWQSDYRFVEPLSLPAESTVVMRITYDNSAENVRNPFEPPRRVKLGSKSTDEMGESTLQMLVEDEGDLEMIKGAAIDYESKLLGGKDKFFFALGLNLEARERDQEAMVAYRRALEANPENAPSLNNLGVLLEEMGDTARAKVFFERAVAADGSLTPALANYARRLTEEGDWLRAQKLYRQVTEQAPENLDAWLALAKMETDQERYHGAIDVLSSASIWHSEEPRLNLQLGKLYAHVGDPIHAEMHFEKALQTDSNPIPRDEKVETYFSLALVRKTLGNLLGAQDSAKRALQLFPENPKPRLLLAALSLSSGDMNQCLEHLDYLLNNRISLGLAIDDIAANLPFPHGVILLSRALLAGNETEAARSLLTKAQQFARQKNSARLTEILENEIHSLE